MSTKSKPLLSRIRFLGFKIKNRAFVATVAAILAVFLLAACATETVPVLETPEATAEPTTAPTPTPIVTQYEEFADAVIPAADPERLAQLAKLLTLVPEGFGSAVYLDMEFLRTNDSLTSLITPEVLGLDVALPSIATGLVDRIAVAADLQDRRLITPFQSDFAIGDILKLAGGFGFDLGGDGPTPYEGHDVWGINALGTTLSMATADETTGVAASGQGISVDDARALVEQSLDSFDSRAARILDTPGLIDLLGDIPSGFAAGVVSECETIPLFVDIQALSGCAGVAVSADVIPGELAVFHALIGFTGPELAESAMERAAEALEREDLSHDFEDLGVRLEGQNVRVRVIVDLSDFADIFNLFTSGE
jgi:hypothetical protein